MHEITLRMTDDEDFDFTVEFVDDVGTPFDLTGYTHEMSVTTTDGAEVATEAACTVTRDDAGGSVNFHIPSATFNGLAPPGRYRLGYRYSIGGRTRQPAIGTLIVEEGAFS